MKILFLIFISPIIFSCNESHKQAKDTIPNTFSLNDVVEKDGLLYLENENVLFSGKIVEKDSIGRIVKKIEYANGLKHGSEIQYKYFESDLAVVVLEGNWYNGRRSGIWKSHDGEGQMTVVKNYDDLK